MQGYTEITDMHTQFTAHSIKVNIFCLFDLDFINTKQIKITIPTTAFVSVGLLCAVHYYYMLNINL